MRTPLIAGNWKMHKTVGEALALVDRLVPLVAGVAGVEVAVAPPFTALHAVGQRLAGTPLGLAAQNLCTEDQGAFTGEVSAAMLRDVGCRYVLVGHSERRQLFGETDDGVQAKTAKALAAGLVPVVCVGETLAQRDGGDAHAVVERQVRGALGPLGADVVDRVVVAYEPVWAIGTGRTATSDQAQEIHLHIRTLLCSLGTPERGNRTRILYGGSVKPSNAGELLGQPDVDGALVGGASLDAETFASIVSFRV